MLTYQIVSENLKWSYIFGTLEKSKERLGIVDYSVSQTTLEQVEYVRSLVNVKYIKVCSVG